MYETILVLRQLYYKDAYGSYLFHMVIGFFLLFNLLGNFIGLWLTDTSTRFVVLPSVIKVSDYQFCFVKLNYSINLLYTTSLAHE